MQDNTVICDHYSRVPDAHGVHYSERDNTLRGKTRVHSAVVAEHLQCSKCDVLTPTVSDDVRLAIKQKTREIIYYKVLSLFAALLALPIRTSINPTKHPKLAKMGRILALPSYYKECAQRELKAYREIKDAREKFEKDKNEKEFTDIYNAARFSIICAQYNRALVITYAYAEPSEIKNLMIPFQHIDGKLYSDAEYDQRRLPNLRKDPLKDLRSKPIPYKTLFEEGYLVSPVKKD